MKKVFALVLALAMILALVACGNEPKEDINKKSDGVMTHAEYVAAEDEAPLVIEAYVQGKQIYSAQYGNTSLYLQDGEGGYFVYRWACTQEQYDAVKVGNKVKVTGFKTSWSGEMEVKDVSALEVVEGNYVATPVDVTSLLGTDDLVKHQNELVVFKGLTVEDYDGTGKAFQYKAEDGSDIYYKVSLNGTTFEFTVESDLCGAGTDAYEAVKGLKVGDKIDVEGFLYWYNGANPHTTKVTISK